MTKNYFSLYAFDRPKSSSAWVMAFSIAMLAISLVLWMRRGVRAASSSAVQETAVLLPIAQTAPATLSQPVDVPLSTSLRSPSVAAPAPVPAEATNRPTMRLGDAPGYQIYVFTFQGQALSAGQSVSKAHVVLHFVSPHETRTLEAVTDADGRYSLKTTFGSRMNDSIEWTLEAQAFQRSPVQVEGRRIITTDLETAVTVDQPLEFTEN